MEAGTAADRSTGSKTIADLMGRAAERFGDHIAVRHKSGDTWHEVTFAQAGEIVREIGLGLIDPGMEPGERVSILCSTRAEWTYCDFAISAAGGVVVPIYPTNSPEECEWVAGDSERSRSSARTPRRWPRSTAVRERLPDLRAPRRHRPQGDTADAIALDELRARPAPRSGRARRAHGSGRTRRTRSPSSTLGDDGAPAASSSTATTATW